MQINEIFSSIDGEGIRTGYLVTFIRTQFCSLKCSYCDTRYSLSPLDENGKKQFVDMSIPEILKKCEELKNKRITFTGGEPLIQKDALELVNSLTDNGYEVNIETNGAVDLFPFIQNLKNNHNVIFTMDWKSPSSGMNNRMIKSNLLLLKEKDVLKFVVGSLEDLDDMRKVIIENNIECSIFLSPIFGKIEPTELVEYIKRYDLQNVRVQLQLHKIIWDVNKRGV